MHAYIFIRLSYLGCWLINDVESFMQHEFSIERAGGTMTHSTALIGMRKFCVISWHIILVFMNYMPGVRLMMSMRIRLPVKL